MVDIHAKLPRIVGSFIRQKREFLGLSQRALGQLFNPTVTTQFISNVERGVTPLPPTHVATLAKALQVSEVEITALLEKEYTAKLAGRLGHGEGDGAPTANLPSTQVSVAPEHFEFFRRVYEGWKSGDDNSRQQFAALCEKLWNIR